jgi:hypothetical protein
MQRYYKFSYYPNFTTKKRIIKKDLTFGDEKAPDASRTEGSEILTKFPT